MFHLAQLNIAKPKFPLDDPRILEFVDNLNRINELGKASPGFVWILEDDSGNATAIHAFEDPAILINLTVWESLESLKAFTYNSEHVRYLRRRHEWFERLAPYLALWWVPAGHIPTIPEARDRMAYLEAHGDTPFAFTFRRVFKPHPPTGEA